MLMPVQLMALPKCEDVWPSGIATFNNRVAYIDPGASILGQSSGAITSYYLTDRNAISCDGVACYATNTNADTITEPTLSSPQTSIPANGQLSGDYYFSGSLTLSQANLRVIGPTRIVVKGSLAIYSSINYTLPKDLIFYVEGSVVTADNISLGAYIYANGYIDLGDNSPFEGSYTAGADTILGNNSTLTYKTPASTNFDGICDSTVKPPLIEKDPIAEYRFDELFWQSGKSEEVMDSVSGSNATAYNLQPTTGKLCNAADFTTSGTSDYISLPASLLDEKNDFTIIAWLKTDDANSRAMLSGANATRDNEVTTWFTSGTSFQAWLVNNPSSITTISNIADNDWHQFAWRRNGNESCVFIDGVLQGCESADSSELDVAMLLLGQEQDSLGGGFSSTQAWQGLVDELLFFDAAIPESQITTIYDNHNLGLGWDGIVRDTYCGANGWWQLEDDFLDANLPDPHNLSAFGSPQFSIANPDPAYSQGSDSTCSYIQFDGSNYASVDDSGDFNYDQLTVSAWVYPTSYPVAGLQSLVSKDEHFEFHINSSGKMFWWWQDLSRVSRSFESNQSLPLNTWTHVAVAYKNGLQQMYINGVPDASRSYTNGLADSPCKFYIGTDVATNTSSTCGGVLTSRNFKGYMDEVRVYSRVQTQTEIVTDMKTVRACDTAPTLDHYRLSLSDNQGLTCEPETMTIEACADDTCSSYYPTATTVGLLPSNSADLTWSDGNSFTLNQFKSITLSSATATTVNYLLNGLVTNPSSSLRCFVNGIEVGASDCKTEFEDVGFKITGATSSLIDDQIAAEPFTAYLQAVKTDDSGACSTILSGNQNVNFNLSHIAPATDAGMAFSINGNNVGTSATAVMVNFDPANDNKATLTLDYHDAGNISFSADKTLATGARLQQTSNQFVVRPDTFSINLGDNHVIGDASYATNANDTVFKQAGEDFNVTVSALNKLGNTTLNFSQNEILSNVSGFVFEHNLQAPSSGVDGGLASSSVSFTAGVANFTAQYDEVGIVELIAKLPVTDYLNHSGGGEITTTLQNVGRFIPAKFEMSDALVSSGCDVFTYQGQPFNQLKYTLTALNLAGTKTQNYIYSANSADNFARASIENLIENDALNGADYIAASVLAPRFDLTQNQLWDKGVYRVDVDNAILQRDDANLALGSDPEAPLTAIFALVKLTDLDGKALDDLDQNAEQYGGTFDSKSVGGPLEVRFGRLVVGNNHGSEKESLQIPLRIEYWNGTDYALNTLDNCSDYISTRLDIENDHTYSGSDGKFDNGLYALGQGFSLDAPDAVSRFEVFYQSPEKWLRFDWDNDGNYNEMDDNPKGVLQFGRFKGNDRVIYWQETK